MNQIKLTRSKTLFITSLVLVGVIWVAAKAIQANFEPIKTITILKIDGKSYGKFADFNEIEDILIKSKDKQYTRVLLKRDFVTDPSLYNWAKKGFNEREILKDLHLIVSQENGPIISEYVLKKSKPLSWTVEAKEPSVGGFSERIELAVQEIAIK